MSELLAGVEPIGPDEEFDPDVALYLIVQQVAETCDELWNARLTEAAFGPYSVLSRESPADGSAYEEAMLDFVKDFVGDQLDQFRERGLIPLILDPETQTWYPITGIGLNTQLLSLVAVVRDPQNPTIPDTKLLGPGTDLAYTDPNAGVSGDEPLGAPNRVDYLPGAIPAPIGHLPFIADPSIFSGLTDIE